MGVWELVVGVTTRWKMVRFRHADVAGTHAAGRAAGRGERTLVAQELDDAAAWYVNQCDAVHGPVLDGGGEPTCACAVAFVVDRAGQRDRVVERARVAVIELDVVTGRKVHPGGARNFEAFADVAGVVVVVQLVDEDEIWVAASVTVAC